VDVPLDMLNRVVPLLRFKLLLVAVWRPFRMHVLAIA
jgi:hypothetical protein